MDEKEVIMRARKDPEAFDYLYEKYFQKIFNYTMMRTQNRHNAEEIVSNVFYKAMSKLYLFKWRSIPFSAWLFRICMNEIADFYRREKRQFNINNKVVIENSVRRPQTEYSYQFLHKFVTKLSMKDQDLISMKFFEKKSYTELSEIFNSKESAIRVRMHRALKKLGKIIPKEVLNELYRDVS